MHEPNLLRSPNDHRQVVNKAKTRAENVTIRVQSGAKAAALSVLKASEHTLNDTAPRRQPPAYATMFRDSAAPSQTKLHRLQAKSNARNDYRFLRSILNLATSNSPLLSESKPHSRKTLRLSRILRLVEHSPGVATFPRRRKRN